MVKYSSLAFFRELEASMFPIDQDMFDQLQLAQCQYARQVLIQNYITEVAEIFRAKPEHMWVPAHLHDQFLRCVRCLQSLHIGQKLQSTAQKIVDLFAGYSMDDANALFIINMIVDKQTTRIRFSPDPTEALSHAFDYLQLVKSAMCSLPVVPSSISSVPGYGDTRILSEDVADSLLAGPKSSLDLTYKNQVCACVCHRSSSGDDVDVVRAVIQNRRDLQHNSSFFS